MSLVLAARLALLRLARDRASLLLALLTAPALAALSGALPGPAAARAPYFPALLVFSALMGVFSSALAFARELETGAFALLCRTPAPRASLILGVALAQLAPGAGSLALTLAIGALNGGLVAGGGRPAPVAALLAAGLAGALASAGLGLLVAAWARGASRAFLGASLLMFAQVLLSGVLFPRPELLPFTVLGRTVTALDLLPTTHLHLLLRELLGGASLAASPRFLALLALAAGALAAGAAAFARVADREDDR